MASIRRVNSSAFDAKPEGQRAASPRELKRLALERVLATALRGAAQDGGRVAYEVVLEPGDKVSTIKSAFKRVKTAARDTEVNLLTVGDSLYVAKRPQTRGRRAKSAVGSA